MKIDLKNQIGVITLNSGHSLINGERPPVISNEMFSNILNKIKEDKGHVKEDFDSFGFWENSSPNYTTYYPDVTINDLKPQDDEFVYPIFRALSATVVWKGYKPIDFSKPGVLKEAMSLLVGQTINADHETALGNAMGTVKSVAWQESFTQDGIKIPAGINAEFKIDGKSNPRIARGIMMDPPAIHSNSVSVRFEWEPSHKMTNNEEFYSKLGTRDDKGNLYRLVVTKILQFSETSLVAHGADPWAQIINNGKLNNPVYADSVYNFSANDDKGKSIKPSHFIDYKTDLSLSFDNTTPFNLNNNNTDENDHTMKLLELLEERFGLDKGTLSEENVSTALEDFIASKETAAKEDLESKLTQAETDKQNLQVEIDRLKPMESQLEEFKGKATSYDESIQKLREDVKAKYQLLKGDDAKDTILNLIETCEIEQLETLALDYEEGLEAKFPSKCNDCQSLNVSKASSQAAPTTPEDHKPAKGASELKSRAIERQAEKKLAKKRQK